MKNFSESQVVINAVIKTCADEEIGEGELNVALMSLLFTSMQCSHKDEHTLCDANGELLLVVKRYK